MIHFFKGNLAISYSVQGDSGNMTYYSEANMTSFVTPAGSGDHKPHAGCGRLCLRIHHDLWFFLTALDVMAPADTVVVALFGDSITDGVHTTLNANDRWANVLSRRLHNAYGNKVAVPTRQSAATGLFLQLVQILPSARLRSIGLIATCWGWRD